jgi:hypothetical protein
MPLNSRCTWAEGCEAIDQLNHTCALLPRHAAKLCSCQTHLMLVSTIDVSICTIHASQIINVHCRQCVVTQLLSVPRYTADKGSCPMPYAASTTYPPNWNSTNHRASATTPCGCCT